jgi:hypothetical protein
MKSHIWPQEPTVKNGVVTISAIIEHSDHTQQHLWYKFPERYQSYISSSCDPFITATILRFMNLSADVVVHGQVSPCLIKNLAEFQSIWACWCPEKYQKIEIIAEAEQEQTRDITFKSKAISTFSGGADSCFTVFRHRQGMCGRLQQNIQAGLMVHGFDVPLDQEHTFNRALDKSRQILNSLDVEIIPVATNFKQLGQTWTDAVAPALASCLMLLQREFDTGLIPSTEPYNGLVAPLGSHPLTDRLLTSDTFQIVHDGADFSRVQKLELISQWPAALKGLRVCYEGPQLDRNCGRCEKCIRTILGFRVVGVELPECFEKNVTNRQILTLAIKELPAPQLNDIDRILAAAISHHKSDLWISELKACLGVNRLIKSLDIYHIIRQIKCGPKRMKRLFKKLSRINI